MLYKVIRLCCIAFHLDNGKNTADIHISLISIDSYNQRNKATYYRMAMLRLLAHRKICNDAVKASNFLNWHQMRSLAFDNLFPLLDFPSRKQPAKPLHRLYPNRSVRRTKILNRLLCATEQQTLHQN